MVHLSSVYVLIMYVANFGMRAGLYLRGAERRGGGGGEGCNCLFV